MTKYKITIAESIAQNTIIPCPHFRFYYEDNDGSILHNKDIELCDL